MEWQLYMINTKDNDLYLDLKYLDRLYPTHQPKGTRLDPISGKSLSKEEAADSDDEAIDELLAPLYDLISDDEPTTEDTKPAIVETLKAEPTKAEALRTRRTRIRKPVAEKLVKQAQPAGDDLAEVVEETGADLNADIASFQEQLRSTDIAAASNNQLLQLVSEIAVQAGRGHYDEEARRYFWDISLELTERDIYPIDRHHEKFDGVACRVKATSEFMQSVKVVALNYVWRWHRGHQVNSTEKKLVGIFEGDIFKKAQAEEIAALSWRNDDHATKDGKLSLGIVGEGGLNLPNYIQDKLNAYRNEAARMRQTRKANKAGKLNNQKMEVEHRLREYAKTNRQMTEDRILIRGNVWLAMRLAEGSITNAIAEYKKLTGVDVGRDFIKDKFQSISKLSKLHKWGIC